LVKVQKLGEIYKRLLHIPFLQEKGYPVEPYEEIGTVKLVKKINDEIEDKTN